MTLSDRVQHEGPRIQILLLCGLRSGDVHTVRVSAASVVRENVGALRLSWQSSWIPATAPGRGEGVEEGEVCSFQPGSPSSHRCVCTKAVKIPCTLHVCFLCRHGTEMCNWECNKCTCASQMLHIQNTCGWVKKKWLNQFWESKALTFLGLFLEPDAVYLWSPKWKSHLSMPDYVLE